MSDDSRAKVLGVVRFTILLGLWLAAEHFEFTTETLMWRFLGGYALLTATINESRINARVKQSR